MARNCDEGSASASAMKREDNSGPAEREDGKARVQNGCWSCGAMVANDDSGAMLKQGRRVRQRDDAQRVYTDEVDG